MGCLNVGVGVWGLGLGVRGRWVRVASLYAGSGAGAVSCGFFGSVEGEREGGNRRLN
jgi:hypothetical protein